MQKPEKSSEITRYLLSIEEISRMCQYYWNFFRISKNLHTFRMNQFYYPRPSKNCHKVTK